MDPIEAYTHQLPHFVEEYKALLSNKRRMADYTKEETLFAKNCVDSGSESRTDLHCTDRELCELSHLLQIASDANNGSMWQHQERGFSKIDANGIFLYQFAVYLNAFLSERVSCRFDDVWPLMQVVEVRSTRYSYEPQSDFSIWTHKLPRFTVDVCSNNSPEHRTRMLLQGASAVRLANIILNAEAEESQKRTFVLMAVYFTGEGYTERCILYQDKVSSKVYYVADRFRVSSKGERLQFASELYNLASYLEAENDDKSNRDQHFSNAGVEIFDLGCHACGFEEKHREEKHRTHSH